MQGGLVLVDEGDKLPDAALVAHGLLLLLARAAVGHEDVNAGVQEGLLPHPLVEDLVVVHGVLEHLRVGLEHHLGAGVVGGADDGHFLGDVAPGELHLVDVPVLVHPHLQPLRQGVDHAGAHAVEAAGDLVAAAAELAAGVEDGVHHLQGGPPGLGLDVHGDAAAVVGDSDDIAVQNLHGDGVAVPGQGLVDGVVHDLIHQVVETGGRGGADVHARSLADRLQPLQDLNLGRAVLVLHGGGAVFHMF